MKPVDATLLRSEEEFIFIRFWEDCVLSKLRSITVANEEVIVEVLPLYSVFYSVFFLFLLQIGLLHESWDIFWKLETCSTF